MSSMPRFLFPLPGFYCATPGLADVTNPCKNGSFCPTGSIVPDPFECTIGFHCPLGSSKPKPCPAGSFTNSSGRDQCDPCPEGFYCFPLELARNESIGYRICPRGYYCPQGTGLDWQSCPAGTYSDRLGLYKESQCQDCDAGKFCDGRNLTFPTDFCAAGYFCTIGKCLKVLIVFKWCHASHIGGPKQKNGGYVGGASNSWGIELYSYANNSFYFIESIDVIEKRLYFYCLLDPGPYICGWKCLRLNLKSVFKILLEYCFSTDTIVFPLPLCNCAMS